MTTAENFHFSSDCQAFKMDKKNRNRFKKLMASLAVLGFLAVVGAAVVQVEAKPNIVGLRLVGRNLRNSEARFAGCQDSQCWELLKGPSLDRVKREGEDDGTKAEPDAKPDDAKTDDAKADDSKTDASKTDDSKTDASKTDDSKTDASKSDMPLPGEYPLPPPTQMFPNLPPNFPYPSIEVVQSPPVPTRPRKRPVVKGPYPGVLLTVPPPIVQPPVTGPVDSTSPGFFDLTSTTSDYETYGPVDPGFSKTEPTPAVPAVRCLENEKTPAQEEVPLVGKVSNEQAATGAAAAYAFAPEDWRFSVTPKAHRRCKPTGSKTACRKQPQPPQDEPSDEEDYDPAPAVPKKPACRKPPQRQRVEYDETSRGEAAQQSGYRQPDPSMVNGGAVMVQPVAVRQPEPSSMVNGGGLAMVQPGAIRQPDPASMMVNGGVAARQPVPNPDPWTIAGQRAEEDAVAILQSSGGMVPAQRMQEAGATVKPEAGKGGAAGLTASVVLLLLVNVFYLLM